MPETIILLKISESAENVRYVEQPRQSQPFLVVGDLSILKAALPVPAPEMIRLSLSFDAESSSEPVRPETGSTTAAQVAAVSSATGADLERTPAVGDLVRVVKNRQSEIKRLPEWLGQYLGKTGVVLRVTPNGGIVEIEGGATWFSYDELELVEQVDRI